jgi:hypothetical protein
MIQWRLPRGSVLGQYIYFSEEPAGSQTAGED